MPSKELPPTDPRSGEIARQKMALTIALVAIGTSAILAMVFLRHYPLPLRLLIVLGDLIVMATLWLVVRQKFSGK